MEASETKWDNSILNIIGINSLRLGGLYINWWTPLRLKGPRWTHQPIDTYSINTLLSDSFVMRRDTGVKIASLYRIVVNFTSKIRQLDNCASWWKFEKILRDLPVVLDFISYFTYLTSILSSELFVDFLLF